jgi:fumarate reductase flavoprotein subunit
MSAQSWDAETDVLIAGAGGCGLVAALHAREYDLQVTLLEKEGEIGGTTAMSGGSIVGAGTEPQRQVGIEDSPEALAEDIIEYTDGEVNPDLVRALAEESRQLVQWLETDLGVDLRVNDGPYKRKGHRTYRRHWLVDEDGDIERNGQALVDALVAAARKRGVELLTNHPITAVLAEDGEVVGVEAGKRQTEQIRAKKVLLATGGFAANLEMRGEYCPESTELLYWGDEGSTGDGIQFGMSNGSDTENMTAYLGFPTIARPQRVFVPWEVTREGAVIVDQRGRRFGDCGSCAYSEFTGLLANRTTTHTSSSTR